MAPERTDAALDSDSDSDVDSGTADEERDAVPPPEVRTSNNEIKPASDRDVERSRRLADEIEHPDDREGADHEGADHEGADHE